MMVWPQRVLAARDMAAERRRAAALDRRHHLELAEADMTGIGLAPRRPVAAEDIRDLQRWTRPWRAAAQAGGSSFFVSVGAEPVERAHDVADRVGGDLGVERRRVELGMPERSRVIMHLILTH